MTEANARRAIRRLGYILRKSRCRTPEDPSFGGYVIIEPERNIIVAGFHSSAYGYDLDDVIAWIEDKRQKR